MPPSPSVQPTDLSSLIADVNRKIEMAIETRLKPAGTRIEHYRLLEALSRADGQSMGELAGRVLVDSPTLTKIVDRMVAHAEVYRAPDARDRRKVLIFLSPKGRAAFEALRPMVDDERRDVVERLADGEANQLRALLTTLLAPN